MASAASCCSRGSSPRAAHTAAQGRAAVAKRVGPGRLACPAVYRRTCPWHRIETYRHFIDKAILIASCINCAGFSLSLAVPCGEFFPEHKSREMVMVNYLGVNSVRELVRQVGAGPLPATGGRHGQRLPPLGAVRQVGAARHPFARGRDRTHAHQRRAAVLLQSTSATQRTRAEGLLTVTAFGVLADVDTGHPLLVSELTLTTALRTAAMSVLAARHLARPGQPPHGADRQRRAERVPGAGLLPPAGHPRAAPVRHRPGRQPQLERNLARLGCRA